MPFRRTQCIRALLVTALGVAEAIALTGCASESTAGTSQSESALSASAKGAGRRRSDEAVKR